MERLYLNVLEQFGSYRKAGGWGHLPSGPIACIERTLVDRMGYKDKVEGGYPDIIKESDKLVRTVDDFAIAIDERMWAWTGITTTQIIKPGRPNNEQAIILVPVQGIDQVESLYGDNDPMEIGAVALFLDGKVVAMYTPDREDANTHVWYPNKHPEVVVPANRETIRDTISQWRPNRNISESYILRAVSEITAKAIDGYFIWASTIELSAQGGRLL